MSALKIHFSVDLLAEIRRDLSRRHSFAFERVGFVFCEFVPSELALLPRSFASVRDEDYLRDEFAAACINVNPIRSAIRHALKHAQGVFHIHAHEHRGHPDFSRTDLTMLAEIAPALRAASPETPHGGFLLSEDRFLARAEMPDGRLMTARAMKLIGRQPQ